jgi:hypothetical protein
MPSGFQDVIIHVSSTAAMGYVILVHTQLYQLLPALVILPPCIIGIIVHFIITSGKADAKLRLAKLFPVRTNDIKDCVVYDQRRALTNNHPSSSSEVNVHQTRRASLQLGLNVIDEIQQIESSGSEESSSDSDYNDHEASDDDYDDGSDDEYDDEDDGSDDDDDDADNNHEGSDDGDDVDDSADESESSVDEGSGYHINTSAYDSVSFDMEDSNASDRNDKSIFNEHGSYNSNSNIQDILYTRNTNSIDDSLQNDLNSENSSVDSICYDSVSEQSSIIIEKLEVNAIGSTDEKIMTPDKGCDFLESDTVSDESF